MANGDLLAIVQPDAGGGFVGSEDDPDEPLAAVLREESFNSGLVAGKSIPVFYARQWPVDSGGADLQGPGAGYRVVDVDRGTDVVADVLAILDGYLRAVGSVGHDLDGRAFAPEHGDTHELKAHEFQTGRDDRGQLAFQGGAGRTGIARSRGWFVSVQSWVVQNKKRRPAKATPVQQRRMISP
jgi:hypothetical protein